ncbi:TrgA family protein [Acidimangrovimonas pyrenivorans]|uniref:TrgA family protein n=1 Tax=Acidimangrovimonas pyrenivorans TaxID=2030798 RepID=A0ABV7AJM1_9RHOB
MPTAAKLIAAIAFALVAYSGAEAFKPAMPPDTQFGYFSYVCAGIGLLCGWQLMGDLVGRSYRFAIAAGLRTSATIVFFALLLFSARQMVLRSMKMRYHGPVDALQAMFGLAVDYGRMMLTPDVLIALLVGGAFAGLLTEWVSRRWP